MTQGMALLVGAMILAGLADPASAQNCSTCETEIKAKLGELDTRLSRTNSLIKDLDRNKLDPLAVKVESITTKLEDMQATLEAVAVNRELKGAVVVEFGAGVAPPFYEQPLPGVPTLEAADVIATRYCSAINYSAGKALVVKDTPPSTFVKARRDIPKLLCFMAKS